MRYISRSKVVHTDRRLGWVGFSVIFDVALVLVPLRMLKQSLSIKKYERLALWVVSGANLLGTIVW